VSEPAAWTQANAGPGARCRPAPGPAASAARSSRAREFRLPQRRRAIARRGFLWPAKLRPRLRYTIAWANESNGRQRQVACTLFDYSSAFSASPELVRPSTFATRCQRSTLQHNVRFICPATCCSVVERLTARCQAGVEVATPAASVGRLQHGRKPPSPSACSRRPALTGTSSGHAPVPVYRLLVRCLRRSATSAR